MSSSSPWASAADADASFPNPYSNSVGKTLAAGTPGIINFDVANLRPGLYDFFTRSPSVAIDETMVMTMIHLAEGASAPNLAAHTPAADGSAQLMRVFPPNAWLSLLITPEFPRVSICFIGLGATIWFVKRYPGS